MSILSSGTSNTTALVYTSDTTGNLVFQTNGTTEAVRIDTNGNVGVGTSTPLSKFHVFGGQHYVTGSTSSGAYTRWYNNAQTSNDLQIGQGWASGSDNIGFVLNNSNSALLFGTNGTERMRITADGNIFINYTNTNLGKFVNNANSATLCIATSGQGVSTFVNSSNAVNNSTVQALRFVNAAGNAMGGSAVCGTIFVNASGGSGANQFQGTYSLLSGGNGTTDASLTLIASKVRGTNPISSVNIADDGGGGAIYISITWANNSGVVTGGQARVGFVGLLI